jgi:hypothetical protein
MAANTAPPAAPGASSVRAVTRVGKPVMMLAVRAAPAISEPALAAAGHQVVRDSSRPGRTSEERAAQPSQANEPAATAIAAVCRSRSSSARKASSTTSRSAASATRSQEYERTAPEPTRSPRTANCAVKPSAAITTTRPIQLSAWP